MRRIAWIASLLCAVEILSGCSGGGDSGGNPAGGIDDGGGGEEEVRLEHAERPRNPAVEGTGELKRNARLHRASQEGYKASVVVTGLAGELIATLGDELLRVSSDGETRFASTFPAGTEVSIELFEQPSLQFCQVMGATIGIIENDRTLQFQVLCEHSYAPDAPVATKIYSADVDTLDIEWAAPQDRNSAPNNISYQVHWALDPGRIEAGTASTVAVEAGKLSTHLVGLIPGTRYHVAIKAIDATGLASPLSAIYPIETIATPNVLTGTQYHVFPSTQVTTTGSTWTVGEATFESAPAVGHVLVSDAGTSVAMVRIESISMSGGVYTFGISPASIADLFDRLTLSSNMLVTDQSVAPAAPASNRPAPAVGSYNTSYSGGPVKSLAAADSPVDREFAKIGICRKLDLNVSSGQTDQITFEPIRNFDLRGINHLEFDLLNQDIGGSYELQGQAAIGVKLGFELADSLNGTLECDLQGLPVKKTLRYAVYGIPIFQEVAFDSAIKLSVDMEHKFSGSAQFVGKASLSAKIFKNPDTDQWDALASEDWGFEQSHKLDYGAHSSARLSIIPKVSTTINQFATFMVSADAGTNAKSSVQAIGEKDPVAVWRDEPYLQVELSSDADVALSVGAKLHWLDSVIAEYPETELYRTEPLRIFDMPRVCTNSSPSSDNCNTQEVISELAGQKTYDLQIYPINGTNNPLDLSSIEWQVSPANGLLEIDEDHPTKATFTPYDNEAYTIVASAHGVLGDAARKYATFAVTGEKCRYGLGHALPDEHRKYLVTNKAVRERWPSMRMHPTPTGLDVTDPEKDFYEVCKFRFEGYPLGPSFEGFPINFLQDWRISGAAETFDLLTAGSSGAGLLTVTYYAGQKNGIARFVSDASRNDHHVSKTTFYDGYLMAHEAILFKPEEPEEQYRRVLDYDLIPIPHSNYKFSFLKSFHSINQYSSSGRHIHNERLLKTRLEEKMIIRESYETGAYDGHIDSFHYERVKTPARFDNLKSLYDYESGPAGQVDEYLQSPISNFSWFNPSDSDVRYSYRASYSRIGKPEYRLNPPAFARTLDVGGAWAESMEDWESGIYINCWSRRFECETEQL